MGFPDCRSAVWLPDSIAEVTVNDQTCQRVCMYENTRTFYSSKYQKKKADNEICICKISKKMFSKSYIILILPKLEAKPCRSRRCCVVCVQSMIKIVAR